MLPRVLINLNTEGGMNKQINDTLIAVIKLSCDVRRTCELLASISPSGGNVWRYEAGKLKEAEDRLRTLTSLN